MTRVARPLVMRCGALGDMVLLTPLIRRLAERFGEPVDLISSGAWTIPLLAGQPGVGNIHLLQSRRRPYWFGPDQWRVVRALKERGVGPTWFLDPERIGRHLLGRGGLSDRWIVDIDDFPRLPGEHMIERFERAAQATPVAADPHPASSPLRGCSLDVSESARADLAGWLERAGRFAAQPLLLVQIGNKRTMRRGDRQRASNTKYWPEAHWAAVIDRLAERHPHHAILLLGVPSEAQLNDDVLALVTTKAAYNVAGDLPIPRLAALMAHADAMVTVDTGPAHVGAAVGLPMLVLYGSVEPALYRPWGATGATVRTLSPEPAGPMEGLPLAPVLSALETLPLRHR